LNKNGNGGSGQCFEDLYNESSVQLQEKKARLKEVDASLLQHHPIIKAAKLWLCKEKKRIDFYSAATGKLNAHYHNY